MKKEQDTTTELIVREATRRGISSQPISETDPNVVVLKKGERRELVYYSCTDQLGHVMFKVFLNKPLTDAMLKKAGFPVPDELVTDDTSEIKAFLAKHSRIVIKPLNSVWGQGVTPGISSESELETAIELAQSFNKTKGETRVLCQQHVTGTEYRILVVNQKHMFAVHRIPAHIEGDGVSLIEDLVANWNVSVREERKINITKRVQKFLKEQEYDPSSIPAKGEKIYLKQVANAHAGGTVCDATAAIGEEARAIAIEVAKHFNAPVIGIDCITPDITKTIGHIIELNSTPDLTLHHYPTEGQAQDPAAKIVDMLFPETAKK